MEESYETGESQSDWRREGKSKTQARGQTKKIKMKLSFADLADLVPTVRSCDASFSRRQHLDGLLWLFFSSCVIQATPVHSRVPRAASLPVSLGNRLRSACATAPTEVSAHGEKKVNVKHLHTIHLSSTLSSRWFGGCTAPSNSPSHLLFAPYV